MSEQDEEGYLLLSSSGEEEEEEGSQENCSTEPPLSPIASPSPQSLSRHCNGQTNKEVEQRLREYLQPKARARRARASISTSTRKPAAKRARRESSSSSSNDLEHQEAEFRARADEDPGPTIHEVASGRRRPHKHQRLLQQQATTSSNNDYDWGQEVEESSLSHEEEEDEEQLNLEADMVELVTRRLNPVLPPNARERNSMIGRITNLLMTGPDGLQATEEGTLVPRHLTDMNRTLRPSAP